MAQQFNPPPGWPLPPGWQPPPDWKPDPSWPPAPAGWQFFVDADPPSRPKGLRGVPSPRRRAGLIAGALAAVVALIGGTVAAVMWFRDSESAPPWPAGMLTATFPTQPQFAWTVQAASLVQGTDARFATPVSGLSLDAYANASNPEFGVSVPGAIIVGDHLLARVVTDSGNDSQLVSLRTADGHVDWSVPAAVAGCATKLVGNTLPCLKPSGTSNHGAVEFIDADTGVTKSTVQVPFAVSLVETDGRGLYTAGSDGSQFVVAKGVPDNPMGSWKAVVSQDQCPTPRGEVWGYLRVAHGLVWGHNGLIVAEAALHDSDGSPVFDHGVTGVVVPEDGSSVAAARCGSTSDQDGLVTDVVDGSGRLRFTSQDGLQKFALDVHAGGPAPFVTVGGDVLDPSTGTKLWDSRAPGNGKDGGVSLVGNVLAGGTADGLDAIDVRSGRSLWGWVRPSGLNGFSKVTDGVRLLISNEDGGIDAVSLIDGTESWWMTGTAHQPPQLYATGQGLLTVTGKAIGLLRPTGPAATVPSIAGDENTGGSGGTRYVTKCGRTPQFIPEAIRTDSGALVIRMKIVAHCPGGDVLSGSRTAITVTSGGQPVAAGVFDLSATPIVIAPESGGGGSDPAVEHDFRFPPPTWSWPPAGGGPGTPAAGAPQHDAGGLDVKTLVVDCDQGGSTQPSAVPATDAPSAHNATVPAADSITFDSMRDFVNAYYGELPANVADAWSKLDPHLGNEHGHQDYVNFWSSVKTISVVSVSPRDNTSVVARLQYVYRDGRVATENRWLSFTSAGGVMRIYDSAVVK